MGSLAIASIYRNRWAIDTFFKWIKGNLTIKSLWGYSENAVRRGAISSYKLLAWVKTALRSPLTISEVAKVVEGRILSRADLKTILDIPESLT